MKHSDYLKKKKTRETRKKIISVISAIVVFITTYALVLPAITLDVSKASQEPGIAYEQMQFKATAAAASVTAADSTVEEAQVEEPAAEEPEEEPAEVIEEEPAETPEEEASAVSAEEEEEEEAVEEAPAEPEQEEAPTEEPAETAEPQEEKSEADQNAAESSSESAPAEAETADTDKAADQASVDQSGTDAADKADASVAATTAETAAEFEIPELDALDFDDILTGKTNFYYYHVENAEEAEEISSDSIDDWRKVGSDTVLAPEDFVRVYLAYEIPAGALNETNAVARYTLPAGLELSDKQIEAINKYENGIAASKSGSEQDKYLGAEAIEGSRTPDEKADDEYIAATVKVKKTDNGRQELVFTFIPYTVEKNQISYDERGEVKSKGKEVKGFFTFDLTTSQIDFEETNTETVDKEDGTTEEIQYSEAKVVFADKDNNRIDRTLTLAGPVEKEEAPAAEQKTLTSQGADYTVTVSYTDDAQIPDNAELTVREIEKDTDEYASYLEQAKGAVDNTKSVNEARFFDITILADGEKVEPQAPVNVQITFAGIEQTNTDDTQLLHYKDDEKIEVMDQAEFSKSEEQTVDTVQFETDGFSVYGIVGTEISSEDGEFTFETDDYTVTIKYTKEAKLPIGTIMTVEQITPEKDETRYLDLWEKTLTALNDGVSSENRKGLANALFMDITLTYGDKEIEPAVPLEVTINYKGGYGPALEEGEEAGIIHFGNDGTEKIEEVEVTSTDNNVTIYHYEQGSFSEIAAYTTGDYENNETGLRSYSLLGATKAAGTLTAPDVSKILTDNGDGTSNLSLSVTGSAATSSETVSSGANVIVVVDKSNSMRNHSQSDSGAYGYSSWQDNGTTTFYPLAVRSGSTYINLSTMTEEKIEAAGYGSTYTGTLYINSRENGSGSWSAYNRARFTDTTRLADTKDAINDLAQSLYDANAGVKMSLISFNSSATNNISLTELTESSLATYKSTVSGLTTGQGTNWTNALSAAYNQASQVASADVPTYVIFLTDGEPNGGNGGSYGTYIENLTNTQLFCIFAFGDSGAATLETLANNAGATFYNASNLDALKAAFADITHTITSNLTYGKVTINDSVSSDVTSVGTSVVGTAGDFTYTVKDKDGNVVGTWTDSSGTAYDNLPGATYTNNQVSWNLGDNYTLKDGYTYTVSFTVWPNQDAYDYVADMNNGVISDWNDDNATAVYADDETTLKYYKGGCSKYPSVVKYPNGTYGILTNTDQSVTYSIVTEKDGVISYSEPITTEIPAPDPLALDAEQISLEKVWPTNMLDNTGAAVYRDENGNQQTATEIELHLTRDNAEYTDITVKSSDSWKKDEVYISCGLMTVSNGVVSIKETGHDYTVTEPEAFSYYWDLIAPVYHPMVINGETTLLVLDEKATSADNVNSFEINGKIYKKGTSSSSSLQAYNYRRSNLNLTKVVTGENVPSDATFTFTATVTDSNSTDGYVWFSAWDPDASATVTTDWVTSGATAEEGNTGYWYAENGATVTFNIKANWNVRYLNLYHGSTFTFTENDTDGFSFISAAGSTSYDFMDSDYTDKWYELGQTTTGSIPEPNNSYTVTYTNKWNTASIDVLKVDENNNGLAEAEFQLTRGSEAIAFDDKTDGKFVTTTEAKEFTLGNGVYCLTETKSPDGYIILSNKVYFKVVVSGSTATVSLCDADGNATTYTNATASGDTVTIKNEPGVELPNTGGPGTLLYTLSGIALMLGAALMYGFRMRRRERRLN